MLIGELFKSAKCFIAGAMIEARALKCKRIEPRPMAAPGERLVLGARQEMSTNAAAPKRRGYPKDRDVKPAPEHLSENATGKVAVRVPRDDTHVFDRAVIRALDVGAVQRIEESARELPRVIGFD